MKVGLITQHRVFNYGSALQTYASAQMIRQLGHEVEVIDYFSEQRTYSKQFFELPDNWPLLSFRSLTYVLARLPGNIRKMIVFNKFLMKYVQLSKRKYISYTDLVNDPPKANVYLTGSDQVWNSDYNQGIDKSYYLCFGNDNIRRVSYAASFGKKELTAEEKNMVKPFLMKYAAISVREIQAQKILRELGFEKTKVVLDPTLLLSNQDWNKIEKTPKTCGYILVMILYGEECGIPEIAEKIQRETGLAVIELVWNPLKKRKWKTVYGCSPEEFLGYVHNASYIVTNSFHVTAFAINYNKDFLSIRRENYNSRIESLLQQLGLEKRYIMPDEFNNTLIERVNYDCINPILDKLREESRKVLELLVEGEE